MKPYIILNTKLKAVAKNEFEKDFLKRLGTTAFLERPWKILGATKT